MNNRRIELLLVLLLLTVLLLISGCSTGPSFVVLRDVPPNPTFVVISATDHLDQIEYANRFEVYLISAGIRVVDLPAKHAILTKRQGGQLTAEDDITTGVQGTVYERYDEIKGLTADYILTTDSETQRVKFIKRVGGEILSSFTIKNFNPADNEQQFRDALVALGLQIRTTGGR